MTLVEVMTVVVIVSVLAILAVVAYRRYVRAARMSEVNNVVSMIMESQHRYKSERGSYANVSNDALSLYPRANPVGGQLMQWGADCVTCPTPRSWDQLGINPGAPVMFGYATVGGWGGQPEPPIRGPGQPLVLPGSKPPPGTPEPFFVITGALDYDANGAFCQVTAVSGSNQIFVSDEDE